MESLEDTKVDDDDGLLMIVVDHENEKKNHSTVKKQLKSDNEASDNTLEYAEDRDKNVEVKLEFEQCSDETYEDVTYLQDDSDYESNEYCEPEYINFKCKKKQREWQKSELRRPEEQQSYVDELRKKSPELKENEKLLIDKLYQKMVKTKPPDPPKDYFVINDIFYECAECGAKKETVPAVSRHWQQRHGPRYAFCFACGDDFRNVTNLYRHEKRCVAPDAILVLKARARMLGRKGSGRPFAPEDLLPAKKKKKVGGFACKDCNAVFKFSRSLSAHAAASHAGPRPYRCDACPAAYCKPLSLYKHRREKHINEPFPCETCGRTFSSKYNLKLHTETHQKLRRYLCEYCDKRYATNRSLRIHIEREHLNLSAPFACHCCPKRYYRIEELKMHMLRVHEMNLISHHSFLRTLPKLSNSVVQSIEIAKKSDPSSQSDQSNIILEESSYSLEITDEVTHCPELDEPGKETDSTPKNQAIKVDDEKITDEYTQCPELDEAGKETDSKSKNQIVNEDDQKIFDFLKCTEKFESGSEIDQQEPIEIQLIEDDGNNNVTDNEKSKENHDDIETQVSEEEEQDNNTPEDLLEYAKNLQQENSNKPKPLIVIKNGQAIFMDKNNVDFFKRKVRKRKITKTEFIKKLKADVESILQQSTPDTFDSNNPISHKKNDEITKTKRTVKNCVSTEVQEICHSKMKTRKKHRRK